MLTTELPTILQEKFERTARLLYENDSTQQALIEAIELWLEQHRCKLIEDEAEVNNRAYENLRAQLEQEHKGKWIVIAHGKLQGVGNSLKEVDHLAPTSLDRIVMQIGENRPREVELGWQMNFKN
jgi:hypothetical protein